jgi:group I intron endonuclease
MILPDEISGVYCIRNTENGKMYVGSSIHINQRFREHLKYLKKGAHCNDHLQAAFNYYGVESFEFLVLEVTKIKFLISREQYWMDFYESYDHSYGYNDALRADRTKHSAKAKEKISIANIKRMALPGAREKMSETAKKYNVRPPSRKGATMSDEAKIKIGLASKGKSVSKETREKIRSKLMGHGISPETKEKISNALRGNQNAKRIKNGGK